MGKLMLVAEPGKQEFHYTRSINAPRGVVFKVYTDPNHISEWWGPRDLKTQVEVMEVRPGGRWHYIQRDRQGQEFGFNGVYHLVIPNEKIINTFEYEGWPGHVSLETIRFEEVDGKTTIYGQSVFQSVEDRDGMVSTGAESGMTDLFDRLEELLVKVQA